MLSEKAQTGPEDTDSSLTKLRDVIKGRNRKSASIFIQMAKPEGGGDSDDERYSAGTAWLKQRDQKHAMEIAQQLHGEWCISESLLFCIPLLLPQRHY